MKDHINIKVFKEKHLLRDKYRVKMTITDEKGNVSVYERYLPTKLEIYKFIRKVKKQGKRVLR